MHYFNVVVHGQICDGVIIWHSHSGIFRQNSTWEDTKRSQATFFLWIVSLFSVSRLILAHLKVLTEILIELFHYFFKDNAVLKSLQSIYGWTSLSLILFLPFFSPRVSVTYSVHPLPVERHHCVGCIAHEDTFVAYVIWGALDRHHGLPGQTEIIPLESITARYKWKIKQLQTLLEISMLTVAFDSGFCLLQTHLSHLSRQK